MENFIDPDITAERKKAIVKSWLYKWMANLEIHDVEEARLTEVRDSETIVIRFKH